MIEDANIYLGRAGEERVLLPLSMCCRHGLIAGATGTGKTVTMEVLAGSFSEAGVPVFLCDVKGDVSGLAAPGTPSADMDGRIDRFQIRDRFSYQGYPVTFWDVYQKKGHPVRATVSDLGPELLSRVLGLSPVQKSVLDLVFRIADDRGLLLIDLKDLRTTLEFVDQNRMEFSMAYGNIAQASIQAVLRALVPWETQGGELFFGEPALDLRDWIRTDPQGRGMISILDCVELVRRPTLYAAVLLWMLSGLFEILPEAGDLERPKLVLFFDEAHLLFRDAPRALVDQIEQAVRLIRSKGVGVFFVTQGPSDLPESVLAQLSNRIQHALRAYTPAEQTMVRAAARSLRPDPSMDTEAVLQELAVGEALASVLDPSGVPGVAARTAVMCPRNRIGPIDDGERADRMASDGMSKYDETVDDLSAYEVLTEQKEADARAADLEARRLAFEKEKAEFEAKKAKEEEAARKRQEKEEEYERRRREKEEEYERRKRDREEEYERRKRDREEEAARKKAEREEEAARKKAEKEEEAVRKKAEKAEEAAKKKAERIAERRQAQIERMLINTGGQVLKRGLLNTLTKKK